MAIEQVILDMKYTLYVPTDNGIYLKDGAKELLEGLEAHEIPYVFATNSTARNIDDTVRELGEKGLKIDRSKIVDPLPVSIKWMQGIGIENIYLISSNEAIFERYRQAGFNIIEEIPGFMPHLAIVVGYDKDLTAEKLRTAANSMQGNWLISLNGNLSRGGYKKRDYDAYSTACFIADMARRDHTYILLAGKPEKEFFEIVLSDYLPINDPTVTAVIGDSPKIDLATPKEMGMTTICIPTLLNRNDLERYKDFIDYVAEPRGALDIILNQTEDSVLI